MAKNRRKCTDVTLAVFGRVWGTGLRCTFAKCQTTNPCSVSCMPVVRPLVPWTVVSFVHYATLSVIIAVVNLPRMMIEHLQSCTVAYKLGRQCELVGSLHAGCVSGVSWIESRWIQEVEPLVSWSAILSSLFQYAFDVNSIARYRTLSISIADNAESISLPASHTQSQLAMRSPYRDVDYKS